ncbi:MAG: 16S rRNA (uracil(1498)-N(3))-methyltransferase [Paracoccaceae bacterium]
MADRGPKIRLFVQGPLVAGAAVATHEGQTHYLGRVMRLGEGAEVAVFDGVSGEWAAQIEALSRKAGVLRVTRRLRAQSRARDLELLFAPVKKARTDFIVEKACELGVRRVRPVRTDFVNAERLKAERLRAHMVEAAEQCGYLGVPGLAEAEPLSRVLDGWDPARRLVFCDERRRARPMAEVLESFRGDRGPWAVLIGPEGGFSEAEAARLGAAEFVVPVSLGPRVLRADTAAVSALTLWQAVLGDWAAGAEDPEAEDGG